MNAKRAKKLRKQAYDTTVGDAWVIERSRKHQKASGQISVQQGLKPTCGKAVYRELKRRDTA